MSKQLDNAELIRTRLLTAPTETELPTTVDLMAVEVIVDRQKDYLKKVKLATAKASGTAVTILWEGFTTLDKNSSKPRLAHLYNLTVWSKPVIAGEELTADDVMESIIARLWQWRPTSRHAFSECEVRNGGLVPDPTYLKYDLEIIVPTTH